MSAWITDALPQARRQASANAVGQRLLVGLGAPVPSNEPGLEFTLLTYSVAVSSLIGVKDGEKDLRRSAELAFETARAIQHSNDRLHALQTACYGVIADRTPDVARYLRSQPLPESPTSDDDWGTAVRNEVYRLWLLLLRKDGWADLDAVLHGIVDLRKRQAEAEESYLNKAGNPRSSAWALIASYHLAKAAEILAEYSAQGSVDGSFDIRAQLQGQFDRSQTACERAELIDLYGVVQLLAATAEKMVANSIWTVTRAVNSRVSRFVTNLVTRAHQKPIFEMLPPQRITLREHNLLGSSQRAVVVSLPTSSGKTFIAQFRILQALNQFDADKGWVAYVAPTRALVNQICAKLRRDFTPLGINVERVSPALDIDGVEAELLNDKNDATAFRVLVATPEKMDMLLRGGWEAKIGRPLTLVVVDEAHNLSGGERGLKLELLLATINRECRHSQFLLLTPFIKNGAEIARWLDPDSHSDISVDFEWRPNDRAIAVAMPVAGEKRGEYQLQLATVHTSKNTIQIEDEIELCSGRALGLSWSNVRTSTSHVAAATAVCLNKRGPVIVVAQKVPYTWSIARTLANDPDLAKRAEERTGLNGARGTDDINFVADFVASEFGDDFELVDMLKKRIGLHHTGLSDETRTLMEWLVERGELDSLVATTTIAQGVNFPVTGVVMASHQYPYGVDIPPEDFWNLAGRAGRADQQGTGVVALASTTDERSQILREYVKQNVSSLDSTLLAMVQKALETSPTLELHSLHWMKEWSAFLQYLAHSYRWLNDHGRFESQVEQILRGSFGYQKLREQSADIANRLVEAVLTYATIIKGKPLALVDSTGFSWESVSKALSGVREARITADTWDASSLFAAGNPNLGKAFGVLFKVPEIRKELSEIIGGKAYDGDLLARIVKDWVAGTSIPDLAREYFPVAGDSDQTDSISKTYKAVYGKLTLTASWGLSALQSLTAGDEMSKMSPEDLKTFQNLPSQVYYGVNTNDAIDLRLLGMPRNASKPMAAYLRSLKVPGDRASLRAKLAGMDDKAWRQALGDKARTYKRAWRVLEGFE